MTTTTTTTTTTTLSGVLLSCILVTCSEAGNNCGLWGGKRREMGEFLGGEGMGKRQNGRWRRIQEVPVCASVPYPIPFLLLYQLMADTHLRRPMGAVEVYPKEM